ncbi:MAG TPA: CoA transferase, partial [Candidatus Binataceae bacterium]
VGNEAMWKSFVGLIGRPALAEDERFSTLRARIKNRGALTKEINQALRPHDADYWIDLLNHRGIPSGPILTMAEIFAHPQIAAREMLLKLPHPVLGQFMTTGLAAKLSATPGQVRRPPLMGEHTEELLALLGYGAAEIKELRAAKVIR